MDFDPLLSSLSEPKDPTEDELIVHGLPQLCVPCTTIKIRSKHVPKKAAKMLGVSIHGYKFTSLDSDEVTAKVMMDVPPHKGNPTTIKREFYGEWTRFDSEAKESVCLAALTYLKNKGLVAVHDTYYVELNNFKRKMKENISGHPHSSPVHLPCKSNYLRGQGLSLQPIRQKFTDQ